MKTIELTIGTSIERAAAHLVQIAPARADFNGVSIRARYASTRPRDIVAHWTRQNDLRSIMWRHSLAGKRHAAEQAECLRQAQELVDAGVNALLMADFDEFFGDPARVVQWVADMANPTDRIGIEWNKPELVALFAEYGWGVNVNTGDEFDAYNPRNFAGWIVGQWLHCGYPGVDRFCKQWQEKFAAQTVKEAA